MLKPIVVDAERDRERVRERKREIERKMERIYLNVMHLRL